ncbi:MAG: MAE_28990/MAE_18760 family HEPN-like nuclease, partial [Acidithiobacillus sp.]
PISGLLVLRHSHPSSLNADQDRSGQKIWEGGLLRRLLLTEIDKPVNLPRRDIINTESNLNSAVFTNILGWIGFESTRYSPRFALIDTALLKARNAIAHGEYFEIDKPRFDSLIIDVLELLRWFKTDIENAVVTQSFLKTLHSEL